LDNYGFEFKFLWFVCQLISEGKSGIVMLYVECEVVWLHYGISLCVCRL